ncbi:MAG: hypothetical protein K9G44_13150 [Melioribacteraceae bacterium]|nr:hypothetical protein [Melioribacteraceae bacterium]
MKSKLILKVSNSAMIFSILLLLLVSGTVKSQVVPESEIALMKFGKIWAGVTANGGKGSFEYRAGFFPNDYGILGQRGQYAEAYTAAGIVLSVTNWYNPDPLVDSVESASVYRMVNEYLPKGKVLEPLTNNIRYRYPVQIMDFDDIVLQDIGDYNPNYEGFQTATYDQIVEVKNEHLFGITIDRKIMQWTQTYHDNYILCDVEIENVTGQTWENFYISFQENTYNIYFSNGSNPSPQANERFNPAITWQHYYGGRIGDSLRVFYEYSADDPRSAGDNMGAPVTTQGGRLIFPDMVFMAILHASKEPYSDPSQDVDDFLQPKITYTGKATEIPYNQADDQFGSSNFYAVRGGYSKDYPMTGNTHPGTFHGINPDEEGVSDYSNYVAGYYSGAHEKTVAFGPYNFEPGKKIRIAWASGVAGIGFEKAQEIGRKWLNGNLENPPAMPDAETGWLPSNFKFPLDATEMDKRKDRWISTGIDSVMLSASRAKWNFDQNYQIPRAPAPPESIEITGYGDGVEIKWSGQEVEAMDNFAGYRIMRRVSSLDTVYYHSIYDSDESDLGPDHVFIDNTVLFGAQYYYYVQSKVKIAENDTKAYPANRGKTLYSSRLLHPNIDYINPPRTSTELLSDIRIAPNPYNINDPILQNYGFTDRRGIIFFNLPGTLDIKIYTENGDLIQTINHDSPVKAGSYTWDMITSNQQVISSGIYIAVFQKPNGEVSYQKFIVVR